MQLKAILIGAGQRGMLAYGPYALRRPNELKFVAVADPNAERRNAFADAHDIAPEGRYGSWEDLLAQPKLADVAIICTGDRMHLAPAVRAMELGYDVLLEKPLSNDPKECIEVDRAARRTGRLLVVCHVLRYTAFYEEMKKLIDSGAVGDVVSVHHIEEVGYWHQAHSFVRGNWRNSDETSPMILSKCCHDMDILNYLIGKKCLSVSSFGSLTHFRPENRPAGAPDRCTDGCPHADACPYEATRLYLGDSTGWPTSSIADDLSMEGRVRALREGPYGRCVYACDNNVVDHQVVNLQYESGITVAMTMCAFTRSIRRETNVMGTMGQITGNLETGEIHWFDFASGHETVINVSVEGGHGGGDFGIMKDFLRAVQSHGSVLPRTSSEVSVMSHMMAFAAERSRLTGEVVDIAKFMEELG